MCFIQCKDPRSQQEAFLKSHPFYQELTSGEIADEEHESEKGDHPDLAFQRDFLMTMDPALGYPTPEKLDKAQTRMKHLLDLQKSSKSMAFAPKWIERGPQATGGRTRAIMWDPNDATGKKAWAGGVTGGLWYNNDVIGGAAWVPVNNFWANLSISCIASDPINPLIFYVGTGEGWNVGAGKGGGIFKSTDAGKTWNLLESSSKFYFVNDLVVRNESGVSVVYAGVSANNYKGFNTDLKLSGLQRSIDGGVTWTQVMPQITGTTQNYVAADIKIDAVNRLWVGTVKNRNSIGGATIFRSEDGLNWTTMTERSEGSRVELAVAASNQNVIYAAVESKKAIFEILKSVDGGQNWTTLAKPKDADNTIPASDFTSQQGWYNLVVAVDPSNEQTVYIGGIDLFKSTNSGGSWTQLSHWSGGFSLPYCHSDQHVILFKPGSTAIALFGNDGGIYSSSNLGDSKPTFTARNRNYNVTQFYTGAIHPTEGMHYFLAGSQDNGSRQFTNPGLGTTIELQTGDGSFNLIDSENGDIQVSSYIYNIYNLSRDNGYTFNRIVTDKTTGRMINPAVLDSKKGILFTYGNETTLSRFYNLKEGIPNRNDATISLGSMAAAMTLSPYSSNSSTLFIGTSAGRLFRIAHADSIPTQTEITGSAFSTGTISCVSVGDSEQELITIFSNYGVKSIWHSQDGGITWLDKEGDLPDMPVRWAIQIPENPEIVVCATELGCWMTENFLSSSPNWKPINDGLANVRVDMLAIRNSDKELIAATYGRGLYSTSDFLQLFQSKKEAHLAASINRIKSGASVNFQDKSTGAPISWLWKFEGGTPETSNLQNPTITYSTSGQFGVTLISSYDDGTVDSVFSAKLITVSPADPVANLTPYYFPSWQNNITISPLMEDFSNTRRLSNNKQLYISYSAMNNGNLAISKDYYSVIYIDSLPSVDSLRIKVLSSYGTNSKLLAGKTRTVTNVWLDSLAPGHHTAYVQLDFADSIPELYESDNLFSYEFEVEASCNDVTHLWEPNGTFEDMSGENTYVENLNCKWLIAPAHMASVSLHFETFQVDSSDTLFISDSTHVYKFTGNQIPHDLTLQADSVWIRFYTNDLLDGEGWKISYEANFNLPDLSLHNFIITEDAGSYYFNLDYRNNGLRPTTDYPSLKIYWSNDTIPDETDDLVIESAANILKINEQKHSQILAFKRALDRNKHYFIAVVDEENMIEELNEDNNYIYAPYNFPILSSESKTAQIYPNPTSERIIVSGVQGVSNFKLTELSGKTILSGPIPKNQTIEMSNLKSGVYLLELTGAKGKYYQKVIKQ